MSVVKLVMAVVEVLESVDDCYQPVGRALTPIFFLLTKSFLLSHIYVTIIYHMQHILIYVLRMSCVTCE